MSRRSFLVAVGIVVFLAGSVGGGLFFLLRYHPPHLLRANIDNPERRAKLSQEFLFELTSFFSDLDSDRNWYARFSDEQINSYLEEAFMRQGLGEKLLPDCISDPHVVFDAERLWLSFNYNSPLMDTIVSVSIRIWLPHNEPNVVALQFEGFRAGALPFSAQWLLERFSDTARQNGIEVNWYRHEGHPVALLRFQADKPRATLQLEAIQIEQGTITIHGRSSESSPR